MRPRRAQRCILSTPQAVAITASAAPPCAPLLLAAAITATERPGCEPLCW